MHNRNYRFDDGQDFSMNSWDRARLDGNDELADRLEAEAQRDLAERLGWEMPVHGLSFCEEDLPPVASAAEPQENQW